MKEFNLEEAKAGAKVCTRGGQEARIVCFDAEGFCPIVALIRNGDDKEPERVLSYPINGKMFFSNAECPLDLMIMDDVPVIKPVDSRTKRMRYSIAKAVLPVLIAQRCYVSPVKSAIDYADELINELEK